MNKYCWSFDGFEDDCKRGYKTDTACVQAAKQSVLENDFAGNDAPKTVYVGKFVPFKPFIDAEIVLSDITDAAFGECGYSVDEWRLLKVSDATLGELEDELNRVLGNWIDKHGYAPDFGTVKNTKEYELK